MAITWSRIDEDEDKRVRAVPLSKGNFVLTDPKRVQTPSQEAAKKNSQGSLITKQPEQKKSWFKVMGEKIGSFFGNTKTDKTQTAQKADMYYEEDLTKANAKPKKEWSITQQPKQSYSNSAKLEMSRLDKQIQDLREASDFFKGIKVTDAFNKKKMTPEIEQKMRDYAALVGTKYEEASLLFGLVKGKGIENYTLADSEKLADYRIKELEEVKRKYQVTVDAYDNPVSPQGFKENLVEAGKGAIEAIKAGDAVPILGSVKKAVTRKYYNDAQKKLKSGMSIDQLTSDERRAVDAIKGQEVYEARPQSIANLIGEGIPSSIALSLEFAAASLLTPGLPDEAVIAASGVSKVSKFMKGVGKTLKSGAKVGAKVTATTGLGRVFEEYEKRISGSTFVESTDDGFKFRFTDNGQQPPTAMVMAISSQFGQNLIEAAGGDLLDNVTGLAKDVTAPLAKAVGKWVDITKVTKPIVDTKTFQVMSSLLGKGSKVKEAFSVSSLSGELAEEFMGNYFDKLMNGQELKMTGDEVKQTVLSTMASYIFLAPLGLVGQRQGENTPTTLDSDKLNNLPAPIKDIVTATIDQDGKDDVSPEDVTEISNNIITAIESGAITPEELESLKAGIQSDVDINKPVKDLEMMTMEDGRKIASSAQVNRILENNKVKITVNADKATIVVNNFVAEDLGIDKETVVSSSPVDLKVAKSELANQVRILENYRELATGKTYDEFVASLPDEAIALSEIKEIPKYSELSIGSILSSFHANVQDVAIPSTQALSEEQEVGMGMIANEIQAAIDDPVGRVRTPDGNWMKTGVNYPSYIPEEYRKKYIMSEVVNAILNNTVPKRGTKAFNAYISLISDASEVANRMDEESLQQAKEFVANQRSGVENKPKEEEFKGSQWDRENPDTFDLPFDKIEKYAKAEKKHNTLVGDVLTKGANITPNTGLVTSLKGKEIADVKDLVKELDYLRGWKYEIFQMVYVKDGKAVSHMAFTSKDIEGVKIPKLEWAYKIQNRMNRLKADGVYFIHNHPSQSTDPSEADKMITQRMIAKLEKKFLGHLIMDTTEYSVINQNESGLITVDTKTELKANIPEYNKVKNDEELRNFIDEYLKGKDASVYKNYVLFGADARLRMKATKVLDVDKYKDTGKLIRYLEMFKKENALGNLFLYVPTKAKEHSLSLNTDANIKLPVVAYVVGENRDGKRYISSGNLNMIVGDNKSEIKNSIRLLDRFSTYDNQKAEKWILTEKEFNNLRFDQDRQDYEDYIEPQLDAIQQRGVAKDEAVVFKSGMGKWVDLNVVAALERGTNAKTKVMVVKRSDLQPTGDVMKNARGERFYELNLADNNEQYIKQIMFDQLSNEVQTDIAANVLDVIGEKNMSSDSLRKELEQTIDLALDVKEVDPTIFKNVLEVSETSEKQVNRLKDLILSGKELDPVIVNGNVLVDGVHRLRAYLELGLKLPVVDINNLISKLDNSGIVNNLGEEIFYKRNGVVLSDIKKSFDTKSRLPLPELVDIDELTKEAKKYDTLDSFIETTFDKRQGYAMSHRPSWMDMPRAFDLLETETLPRDVYQNPEYSLASGRNMRTDIPARESWSALLKIRNKPDAEVTIYRATRKDQLNIGDWVTFSKSYAEESVEGNEEKVYSFKVKAQDVVFAGDDVNEFGYYPRSILESIWNKVNRGKDTISDATESFDTKSRLPLPELVDIAKQLTAKGITIGNFKASKMGMVNGRFTAKDTMNSYIKLNKDLFTPQGEEVLDEKGKPTRLPETPEESAARVAKIEQVLAHEIGHAIDFLPDGDLKRGNLLGSIATLHAFMDKEYDGIKNKDINEELKALTQLWKPFEEQEDKKYTKYRYSARELYADALSVMFNNPKLLQQIAPSFYDSFTKYLSKKPEAESALFEAWDAMITGQNVESRIKKIQSGYDKAGLKRSEIDKTQVKSFVKTIDGLKTEYVTRFHPLYLDIKNHYKDKGIRASKKQIVRNAVEKLATTQDRMSLYTLDVEKEFLNPLIEAGVSEADMGTILQLKRSLGDRKDIANPSGMMYQYAQETLDTLMSKYNDTQKKLIQNRINWFKDYNFDVIKKATEAGVFSQKFFEEVATVNKNSYTPFQVIDYIEKNWVSASVIKAEGTFKDVENPIITQVLKSVAIINKTEDNIAKRTYLNVTYENFQDELILAKEIKDVTGKVTGFKTQKGYDVLEILVDGKRKGFHVDPYISNAFAVTRQNEQNFKATLKILRTSNRIAKSFYTSYNIGFTLVSNPIRDLAATQRTLYAKTSKLGVSTKVDIFGLRLAYQWIKALRTSRGFAKGEVSNQQIRELVEEGVLSLRGNLTQEELDSLTVETLLSPAKRLTGLLKRTGTDEKTLGEKIKQSIFFKPIVKLFEVLDNINKVLETNTKLAGYQILRKSGKSQEEAGFIARNYVGTPNFREKGTATFLYNEISLFANVATQGTRTHLELAVEPKTRAGYWMALAYQTSIPTIAMALAAGGLFGDDLEELFALIPEYHKTNYLIIPLGKTDGGKAVYIKIPRDEPSRLLGALIWKGVRTMQGEGKSYEQIGSILEGQMPFSGSNPLFDNIGVWLSYAQGRNPYDDFRGREAIDKGLWDQGGWVRFAETLKLTATNTGVVKFNTYDPPGQTFKKAFEQLVTTGKVTRINELVVQVPAISRLLGVSDKGIVEQERELQKEQEVEAKKVSANKEKEIKGIVAKVENDGNYNWKADIKGLQEKYAKGDDGKIDSAKATAVRKAVKVAVLQREGVSKYNELMVYGVNVEDKARIINKYKSKMSGNEFNEYLNTLAEYEIATEGVITELRKQKVIGMTEYYRVKSIYEKNKK